MIRPFADSDTEAMIDIWYAATTLAHPFMTEAFKEQEKINIKTRYIPITKSWIYEVAGKPVGFIAMIENEVGAIFLDPNFHGQGIGYALMNHICQFYDSIELDVFEANHIGRKFYKKFGFQKIGGSIHEATAQPMLRLKYNIK